jgi:uncharacterized membrane protein
VEPSENRHEPALFVLLMVFLGTLLVLAPDYVYLRDLFSYRINTVFKFYYQAWMVWSLAGAFGVAVLLQEMRGLWSWVYRIGLGIVLILSLFFPVLGLSNKTDDLKIPAYLQAVRASREAGEPSVGMNPFSVWTLDGTALFSRNYPDDATAARWLLKAPPGVVAEAASKNAYSDYGRMAAYSGQPAVLGWWWHEYQWRGTLAQMDSPLPDLTCRANFSIGSYGRTRADDISCLYEAKNWDIVSQILSAYYIRYVVIGTLERRDYRINEALFQEHLSQVFQQGQVVIYEVP